MNKEQSSAVLYTILGCLVGLFSSYVTNGYLILLLVFGVYFSTLIPVTRKVTVKKLGTWLFSNTFLTYILVWLVVFILLSNAM